MLLLIALQLDNFVDKLNGADRRLRLAFYAFLSIGLEVRLGET